MFAGYPHLNLEDSQIWNLDAKVESMIPCRVETIILNFFAHFLLILHIVRMTP